MIVWETMFSLFTSIRELYPALIKKVLQNQPEKLIILVEKIGKGHEQANPRRESLKGYDT